MQAFVVLLAAAAVLLPPSLARAQGNAADPPGILAPAPPPSDEAARPAPGGKRGVADQTLDQLFGTLSSASADDAAGRAAEAEIRRRWLRSGSATIDLLMGWANQSMQAKDYGRALDFLDSVVMLKPDFVEGWNHRATVFYMRDEYGKAISDLEKVLALEPRHFAAMAGLGMILQEIDRKADAFEVLNRAVEIDPFLGEDVKKTIEELRPNVEGKDI